MSDITNCEVCQSEFIKNAPNQKYCYVCAKAKKRECQKRIYLRDSERIKKHVNEYRLANNEKIKARKRASYHLNIEESRAKDRARRQRDKEKRREQDRTYYLQNRDRLLEDYAKKYRANPDVVKARVAQYNKEHPEWCRERSRMRRVREKGAEGSHTLEQFWYVCDCYLWRCVYCGCELTKKTVTEDHATPLVRGGSDWISNILPACRPCNSRKQDKTYEEYMPILTRIYAGEV